MSAAEEPGLSLQSAVASASEACGNALADYRAGFIDDAELRRLLAGSGIRRLRRVVDELAREADGSRGSQG